MAYMCKKITNRWLAFSTGSIGYQARIGSLCSHEGSQCMRQITDEDPTKHHSSNRNNTPRSIISDKEIVSLAYAGMYLITNRMIRSR